ncbi:MAG: DNA-formamidopyrimidine glycosylase [Candidatus Pacebacteria bacterium RIFOXYB1_FULL_39_46]|nr:MAG: DNA-formamidopyrimidine glycosylase [Candidatus Pacebacteria bacterium RIFOXYB1_FULL_39_46]OGJ39309.1 MAG: DNA-formamidopyrimidine glycosylase [Candidatus Pacebacteria bacterium RIFOXYA1_FULL_38_18]OGJ40989.1 MAG: DNA-formamidopyrimidine glycosylase [Candidatus Pacebacteria bacterium RIFOXYD1_FULL_39_27]OGJ41170.1 MAG: DNA-formamidopyrimidine glycosylase [Candidatus Pacebacteria bacterium RIFOXYC1_FULL_39_21]
MPELPEVETVVRRLAKVLPGKVIKSIEVLRDKSFQGKSNQLKARQIIRVNRRAKMIHLEIEGDHDLLIHLKMTGQLVFVGNGQKIGGGHPTGDWVNELPSNHTRAIINFQDGSILYFNDMRVFGWMRMLDQPALEKEFNRYGPDANSDELTVDYFKKVFAHRSIPIKQAIMDNVLLSGIGNIYASEALFYAGIHPQRSAKSLIHAEWKKLHQAIRMVLDEGIKAGGTTFDGKYVNADGLAGHYQDKLMVYGRAGELCLNCQTKIGKIKLAGRGSYFCPRCQT